MLKLIRAYLDNCTIGEMYYRGELVCYTVERPWLDNKKSVSCIPAGTYRLLAYSSKGHPNSFIMENTALNVGRINTHRTYCLIHPANFPHEVEGCIGPGLKLHPTNWGVSQSRKAMDKLRNLITTNNITQLEIV